MPRVFLPTDIMEQLGNPGRKATALKLEPQVKLEPAVKVKSKPIKEKTEEDLQLEALLSNEKLKKKEVIEYFKALSESSSE
jgi:hypothetical protein